jgi:DNA primase small subunit
MALDIDQVTRAALSRQRQECARTSNYFVDAFPVATITRLLYANFSTRELCLTLAPKDTDAAPVKLRYQSVGSETQLRSLLARHRPVAIDVGAYNGVRPELWRVLQKKLPSSMSDWMEKELVLDIDLKDVQLRTCACAQPDDEEPVCPGCKAVRTSDDTMQCACGWTAFDGKICIACWNLAHVYSIVMEYCLRKHWGFKHIFFVFSGGKGFHCWVMDDEARQASVDTRQQLVHSLQPFVDWPNDLRIVDEQSGVDSFFGEDFDTFAMPLFLEKIVEAGIFDIQHINTMRFLLRVLPIEETNETLAQSFMDTKDAASRAKTHVEAWNLFSEFIAKCYSGRDAGVIKRRLVYAYLFPVLDSAVSLTPAHLLKCPFSMHPTTNRVAIPMKLEDFYSFLPDMGPTSDDAKLVTAAAHVFDAFLDAEKAPVLSYVYCSAVLPDVVFPMDPREARHIVFAHLMTLLRPNVTTRSIFKTERAYRLHSSRCLECQSQLLLDRRNRVDEWIRRSCFIDGMYMGEWARVFTLALTKLCNDLRLLRLTRESAQQLTELGC